MLIGRGAERERLEALVGDAVAGRSGALLVRGPAGIGKTALVREAVELGRRRGVAVLGARGIEAESDVPFAGLHELLSPVLGLRHDLPEHHRRALEIALGIDAGPAPDAFAVAAALLAFLSATAERHGAVLVVLDDAHWVDAGSLDTLLFVVRRLHAEGVAVVVSARPTPDRGLGDRGLEELALDGLGDDDARALARSAAGDAVSDPACRRIADASRGFPLALVELGRSLAADPERDHAADATPQRPSQVVERVFRDDLERLSPGARRALGVAAADERASRAELLAALEPSGIGAGAHGEAQRAGRVGGAGGPPRVPPPRVQSVGYHGAA
ncbi:ATP-binding protein, partial [Patulibacter sp. NPDC049589]|uniref:ATP-binding protein n=1 Tax=Patulibacter sp. NPDC049589 TaxID=3154731 RepID=UPI003448EC47